jgi:hypothetical protein
MRKFFAVTMGSLVALAGFASTANASATVDLVWITTGGGCFKQTRRDCPQLGTTLSNIATSDVVTLAVILTAGPAGSLGGGVSADYSEMSPVYNVSAFRTFTTDTSVEGGGTRDFWLTLTVGDTTNNIPLGAVQNINAAATGTSIGAGLGLPPTGSAYLGTVSFHKVSIGGGTFEIAPILTGTDKILDGVGNVISPTFNSAYTVNVPEPGALSLLVMGVGGMLLAGRGRRS